MNFKKFESVILSAAVASTLLMGGCARNISNDVYSDRTVGESAHTHRGHVISMRNVTVGPETLGENTGGALAGGVLGGIGGSLLGGGRGHLVGAGLGAVGGAIGGSLIEKELKTQNGIEYTVELENGQLRTVVQGPQPIYPVGSRVLVLENNKGRARITADNSASIR